MLMERKEALTERLLGESDRRSAGWTPSRSPAAAGWWLYLQDRHLKPSVTCPVLAAGYWLLLSLHNVSFRNKQTNKQTDMAGVEVHLLYDMVQNNTQTCCVRGIKFVLSENGVYELLHKMMV